jgi:hypothetical protein
MIPRRDSEAGRRDAAEVRATFEKGESFSG